ncbi:Alpha/Beta hydrolase protein [Mycena olivaceomarginata]|nr:Alpha/Beta hydrolase protein [Mycena olivaceomarginata]
MFKRGEKTSGIFKKRGKTSRWLNLARKIRFHPRTKLALIHARLRPLPPILRKNTPEDFHIPNFLLAWMPTFTRTRANSTKEESEHFDKDSPSPVDLRDVAIPPTISPDVPRRNGHLRMANRTRSRSAAFGVVLPAMLFKNRAADFVLPPDFPVGVVPTVVVPVVPAPPRAPAAVNPTAPHTFTAVWKPYLAQYFVLYTKYSAAAYQAFCARPVGRVLVRAGFIARDPARLEIVVFRGTFSLKDAITDAKFLLVPFESPGIVELVHVHRGFLGAYQNVSDQVVGIVSKEIKEYPTFRIVVTALDGWMISDEYERDLFAVGHSLGGAIASLAAPSIKAALPDAVVKLYTFGQPRAGNAKFARYVERMVGAENIHRAVHTLDGVPTMVPRIFGYEHFATEYWQFRDPLPGPFALVAPHETVTKCEGNEDKKCSVQFPSGGINPFYTFYFRQVMAVNPLLCS